jgi:hypothetical protein
LCLSAEGNKSKAAIMTGKYDMKMLALLGQSEEDFKRNLADVWQVEDEDELSNELQELTANDVVVFEKMYIRMFLIWQVCVNSEGYHHGLDAALYLTISSFLNNIEKIASDYKHR